MSYLDLIPSDLGPETMLEIAAGVGSFLTVLALGRALVPSDPLAARARAHARRRKELRAELVAPKQGSRRPSSVGMMRALVEALHLTRGDESKTAAAQLAQAGWRTRDALAVFLGLRIILPLVFGALAFLGAATLPAKPPSLMTELLIAVVGIGFGALAPSIGLNRLIERRRRAVQKGLPDALDLMVICAEAGLSLDATLTRVAREIGATSLALADEFGLTAIELGFLPNRRQALVNLTRRVSSPAVRGVVNTLIQTERYGTPLAHSLRVLASEFRDVRMLKAEEKAAKLPATLTVPMIVFILPTLFVVLIGPAIIQVMHTFGR
jgi:tight adherence protein C